MKKKVFVTVVEVVQAVDEATPQMVVDCLREAGWTARIVKAGSRMVES